MRNPALLHAQKLGKKEVDETAIFWLKNRNPAQWRDAWQLEHITGKYVISDRPLTEDEWIKQTGATVIEGEATVRHRTIFA